MIDKFDKYISEYALEGCAEDYWYDEGVTIAEQMLDEFDSDDWDMLLKTIPERTAEWQKRMAYCMHDKSNPYQLTILLQLAYTDDNELFEIVVDSLRGFTGEECPNLIQSDSRITDKIRELLPKAGDATKQIFEDFLNKQGC